MANGAIWIGKDDGDLYYIDSSGNTRHAYKYATTAGVVSVEGEVAFKASTRRLHWMDADGNEYYADSDAGPTTSEPNGSFYVSTSGLYVAYNGVGYKIDIQGPDPSPPPPDPDPEPEPTTFFYYEYSSGTDTLYEYWFNGTTGVLVDTYYNPCPGKSLQLQNQITHENTTYWTSYGCINV